MREKIRNKLNESLQPVSIEVVDESHRHAGHFNHGDNPKETHFVVQIVADKFTGLSKVARHRLIYSQLSKEFDLGLHALSIKAFAPNEFVDIGK